MSRGDQAQLKAIEDGIQFDEEARKCTANYPYIRDPSVLTDNYVQAKKIQEGIEAQIVWPPSATFSGYTHVYGIVFLQID